MILIIGVGALGTVAAHALRDLPLTLQDYDIVQASNLERTPFFTEEDIDKPKAAVAAGRLGCLSRTAPFGPESSLEGVSLIIECSDNLGTKLLVNDAARKAGIPLIVGVAAGDRGMAFVNGEACWQCVTHGKTPVDDCETGIDPDIAQKVGETLAGLARGILAGSPREGLVRISKAGIAPVQVRRNPACEACRGVFAYLDAPFSLAFCPGTRKLQARPSRPLALDLGRVPGEVLVRYPTAVRVRLGAGSVLVHRHGLLEFENVPPDAARAFWARVRA